MTILHDALRLAAAGMPVFPCRADKKPACRHGFHDASRDPATIKRMFASRSAALIGVPTGEASGIDVLDVDPRHGGAVWYEANLHRLPATRAHRTQSGGLHLLFLHAPGVRNSESRAAAGIDVRGDGGYAIVPPSLGYTVADDAPPAHWPDWLLSLALPAPPPPRAPSAPRRPVSAEHAERIVNSALARVRAARDGQKHFVLRNTALLLGGIAADAGIADADAVRWLVDALPASIKDETTAARTAAWGLTQGRARPITLDAPRAPDPRRRDTARLAFRLLRMGVPGDRLLAALHQQNAARPDPLPAPDITRAALWAAEQRHAR